VFPIPLHRSKKKFKIKALHEIMPIVIFNGGLSNGMEEQVGMGNGPVLQISRTILTVSSDSVLFREREREKDKKAIPSFLFV
jgi:hypothetical protein